MRRVLKCLLSCTVFRELNIFHESASEICFFYRFRIRLCAKYEGIIYLVKCFTLTIKEFAITFVAVCTAKMIIKKYECHQSLLIGDIFQMF